MLYLYHATSVVSLLLQESEVQPKTSVNNNDITRVSMI